MTNKCSDCGCDEFEIVKYNDDTEYKGISFVSEFEYSTCKQCGEIFIFTDQIIRNDEIIKKAWQEIDNDNK